MLIQANLDYIKIMTTCLGYNTRKNQSIVTKFGHVFAVNTFLVFKLMSKVSVTF